MQYNTSLLVGNSTINNTHQRKTSPSTRKRNRLWQIYQCSLEIGSRLTVTNIRALDLPLSYYTISNIDFQAVLNHPHNFLDFFAIHLYKCFDLLACFKIYVIRFLSKTIIITSIFISTVVNNIIFILDTI